MVLRYREHELVMQAREQARSAAARADYRRRRHLMEGSFAQAANCHGFKRARWRRLWRQQVQDWLIAACQNVKILVRALRLGPQTAETSASGRKTATFLPSPSLLAALSANFQKLLAPPPRLTPAAN